MSNSPLVVYTKLSPNHSGKRNHSIIYFTPHCVVGQCSIESLGKIFANPARRASSNYGIGTDGRVGLFVDEANRAWTSSSPWNDNRAITVECASDASDPWAFKSIVYNKLVDLLVDCCRRNGKNKVLWFGDKDKTLNYTPASNEMVLTVHRWYAATACPGTWMYSRMGQLAKDANEKLNYNEKTTIYNGMDYKLVYDPDYYYDAYPDLQKAFGKDWGKLIKHFYTYGMKEGRQARPNFNVITYKYLYDDLQKAYGDDLKKYYEHYIKYGNKEGRFANADFFKLVYDGDYYVKKYSDLKKAFGDDKDRLFKHFINYGMKEGRQAIATFNVKVYKENYSDLRNAFGDDLPKYYVHYINYGYNEHREAVKKIR